MMTRHFDIITRENIMSRKNGITTRYKPVIMVDESLIIAEMKASQDGQYVSVKDYEHALGVIRKLRTKMEKRNRRHKAMLNKDESSEFLTLEEQKNVKVGEVYKISGWHGCNDKWSGFNNGDVYVITKIYDRSRGDFGFNFEYSHGRYSECRGSFIAAQYEDIGNPDFKMQRVN